MAFNQKDVVAMDLDKATACVTVWKNTEMLMYALSLIKAGLATPTPYFGPDDVPENLVPPGNSIPGIVTKILMRAGIIAPYFGNHPDKGIIYGRRRSRHESRNGAKIGLYTIVRPLGLAIIHRHGLTLPEGQLSLGL